MAPPGSHIFLTTSYVTPTKGTIGTSIPKNALDPRVTVLSVTAVRGGHGAIPSRRTSIMSSVLKWNTGQGHSTTHYTGGFRAGYTITLAA